MTSYDQDNPSGRAGIVVVLHRDKALTDKVEMTEIRREGAMIVRTRWHTNENLLFLLYMPH
jgi:hypothetical protein